LEKKLYVKPEIMNHELISFETGLSSCIKVATVDGTNPVQRVCLKADNTWHNL